MKLVALFSLCSVFSSGDFWLSEYRKKTVCSSEKYLEIAERENGIKKSLMAALIYVESGWKKTIVSSAGACGLTQVIPKYTGGPAIRKKYTCDQLKIPKNSILAGSKILSWWIDYHDGNLERALCGYNAGFRCGHIKKPKIRPNKYGMRYARKVLRIQKKIELMRQKKME